MSLTDFLLGPFIYPFMQQAMLISLLVAIPMGLLSSFLILKGWSLMGDAISHAVLPGIVIAYIVGLPLGIGAFFAGMACSMSTGFFSENSRLKEDTVMGVVFSGMFAIGLVMFVAVDTNVHLTHILFGNPLGVTWGDIAQTAAIALITVAAILAFRRDLMLHAFDAMHARAIGLPVRFLHYGLLALISLTIVAALQAVGIILAIAFLIAPGAIAFLLVRRFSHMLVVAVAVSSLSTVLGIYLCFIIDSAPAPTIVLVMTVIFIAAFGWSQASIARATRLRAG